jgi:hypothetical protein
VYRHVAAHATEVPDARSDAITPNASICCCPDFVSVKFNSYPIFSP